MQTIRIAFSFRFRTLQHTNLKTRWGILFFLNESSAIALDVKRKQQGKKEHYGLSLNCRSADGGTLPISGNSGTIIILIIFFFVLEQ